jgi:hypothetical protein
MSHCKLEYDGNEEEYAEFYDFSSYNAQHMQESISDHPPHPGIKTYLKFHFLMFFKSEHKPLIWTPSELFFFLLCRGVTVFETSSGELVLRDKNKVLGHRSLQIYYKQRPRHLPFTQFNILTHFFVHCFVNAQIFFFHCHLPSISSLGHTMIWLYYHS